MKNSLFNNHLELHKGYDLIYNSLSDNFLIHKLPASVIRDVEYLYQNHPEAWSKLVSGGFLVEDAIDEEELLINLKREEEDNLSKYILIVNPTINCNFKCWYCYETHVPDSKLSPETLTNINNHIKIVTDNPDIKDFELSFFGGEPLLYYKSCVLPLMKFAHDECKSKNISLTISFTTNGYLFKDNMLQDFNLYGVRQLQITLDGCKEDHDKIRVPANGSGSYEQIIHNIKALINSHIFVRLRVNYTYDNLKKSASISEEFQNIDAEHLKYLQVDFHKVWQAKELEGSANAIDDVCQIFRNKDIYAAKRMLNNVRNPCYADKRNEAVINYNGDVYKCTARDFHTEKRDGYLTSTGEIVWEKSIGNRMIAKYRNRLCATCTISPLCYGICSQKAVEAQSDYCMYPSAAEKNDVILERLSAYILNHEVSVLPSI